MRQTAWTTSEPRNKQPIKGADSTEELYLKAAARWSGIIQLRAKLASSRTQVHHKLTYRRASESLHTSNCYISYCLSSKRQFSTQLHTCCYSLKGGRSIKIYRAGDCGVSSRQSLQGIKVSVHHTRIHSSMNFYSIMRGSEFKLEVRASRLST